ncbi:discoidin domain-containing protein [Dactylosporangium sp. NPDC051485]|uniref:discoidin domain-containing protein n=1 Tax=Dactylosporangium sp. NPDC051485 TaxID=3154846 RepID=UPI003415F31A
MRRLWGRSPSSGAVLAASCGLAVLIAGVAFAHGVVGKGDRSAPGCGTADVARAAAVTASSTDGATTQPGAAVDGDPGTRWSSAWDDPQWLMLDLHRRVSVCRVVLDWEAAYATAFDLEVSDDGRGWRTVYSTTSGHGGRQVLDVAGSGSYLRLHLRARATRFGYSLFTVAVFEGTAADPRAGDRASPATRETLLSYRKPVTASSHGKKTAPANAVDNLAGTQWATANQAGGPSWLAVDLGAPARVSRVSLQWGEAHPAAYDIQLSGDGGTWRTVYHTDAGKGLREDLAVAGSARYVRLSSDQPEISLWELSVYGTGGAPLAPPPVDPTHDPRQLVWSDEFDGPAGAPPDPDKWTPDTGPGVTGELQYYTDNRNAFQDGQGHLSLEARREVVPGTTCPLDPMSKSTTCQYTSARLNTSGHFSFQYGRAEARIKVSGTQGLWPAFWLLGADLYTGAAGWPECGEIDVMEHVGRQPDRISSTLHGPGYRGGAGIGAPYVRPGTDFAADYHVYAADWRPDRITFSVDGQEFFTVRKDDTERGRGPWPYDHPFVLLINNAVGGPRPRPPPRGTG